MKGGPRCPCCGQTTGPFRVGRIVKVTRVAGKLRPAAWVTCRRLISYYPTTPWRPIIKQQPTGQPVTRLACGWSWWSLHPDLVTKAKRNPRLKLVRAKQGQTGTRPFRNRAVRNGRQ